ncbi:MAG: AAA family ATPase [Clostridia bacterium]|nr:AAA family ATPase [Clostridia bacterium]
MQSIRFQRTPTTLPRVLAELLPASLSDAIRQCGATHIEEIRLHSGRYASVTSCGKSIPTQVILDESDLRELLLRMCAGSLYAFSQTINQGYITLSGGIRVGVCGSAAVEGGAVIGVNRISGLMIRVPHATPVSPAPILEYFCKHQRMRGVLIYAPPGVGKTTLLRAIARDAASPALSIRTLVVDTREELHFSLDAPELSLDILRGYPREIGIEIAVRSMGAQLIVCDEIGGAADAQAILTAANCGVPLIASVHAADVDELLFRPFMRALHDAHVFGAYVGIGRRGNGDFSYLFTEWANADRRLRGREEAKWS